MGELYLLLLVLMRRCTDLLQLLECVATHHPHHSLNVILSLANANIDAEIAKVKTRKSESSRLSRPRDDTDAEEVRHDGCRV